MPALTLGLNAYKRNIARSAEIKLFNMLLERDPINEIDGLMRVQRPGLAEYLTLGNGPMRGIIFRADVNSTTYVVMGTQFYAVTPGGQTLLGTIPGTGLVSLTLTKDRVVGVTEGIAYSSLNDAAVTTIVMPDGRDVQDVAQLNGYFLLAERSASGRGNRVYWIAPGETNPDALSFFSAEYNPDSISAIRALGEEIWIFGAKGPEVWGVTGDADAPFQRIPGRLFNQGALARETVRQVGNGLIWVTPEGDVVGWFGGLKNIGDAALAEKFKAYAATNPFLNPEIFRAWTYTLDGHTLYVVSSPEWTYACDISSDFAWSEFGTVGRDGWQAHLGCNTAFQGVLAGDDTDNIIWTVTSNEWADDGLPFVRTISGGATVLGKPIANASLEIRMATGWAGNITAEPDLLYRYSDDEGNTFTDWDTESIGLVGRYGGLLTIRRQGIIEAPGRLYELQYAGEGQFRVSYARIGEATGARPGAPA
jgi:hypothetical protein